MCNTYLVEKFKKASASHSRNGENSLSCLIRNIFCYVIKLSFRKKSVVTPSKTKINAFVGNDDSITVNSDDVIISLEVEDRKIIFLMLFYAYSIYHSIYVKQKIFAECPF